VNYNNIYNVDTFDLELHSREMQHPKLPREYTQILVTLSKYIYVFVVDATYLQWLT